MKAKREIVDSYQTLMEVDGIQTITATSLAKDEEVDL